MSRTTCPDVEIDVDSTTASHRPTLLKYHSRRLHLQPEIVEQPYVLTVLSQAQTAEEATSLEHEIETLERTLRDEVRQCELRLQVVKRELSGRA